MRSGKRQWQRRKAKQQAMSSDRQAASGEEEPGEKWSGAQAPNFRALRRSPTWWAVKPDSQVLGFKALEHQTTRILPYIRPWTVSGPFWTVLGAI